MPKHYPEPSRIEPLGSYLSKRKKPPSFDEGFSAESEGLPSVSPNWGGFK
ncbi:hypothetical protein [Sphingobacterium nematocida]|nr:hypothetical protein [Sphingobacterium nematocida]